MAKLYNREQAMLINRAWAALEAFYDGWPGEVLTLKAALKTERAVLGVGRNTTELRFYVLRAWHQGMQAPDCPARALYRLRPGLVIAYVVGAHSAERGRSEEFMVTLRDAFNGAFAAHENRERRERQR